MLNLYLENHFLDFAISGVLIFVLINFNLYRLIDIADRSSFISSLIGVSSAIWGFGALSATILVSIVPSDIFNELRNRLGVKILKNIFISLSQIFLAIILFLILSIKFIQELAMIEMSIFMLAFVSLIGNTARFTIILYSILKISVR